MRTVWLYEENLRSWHCFPDSRVYVIGTNGLQIVSAMFTAATTTSWHFLIVLLLFLLIAWNLYVPICLFACCDVLLWAAYEIFMKRCWRDFLLVTLLKKSLCVTPTNQKTVLLLKSCLCLQLISDLLTILERSLFFNMNFESILLLNSKTPIFRLSALYFTKRFQLFFAIKRI